MIKKRVLIVEDNPGDLILIRELVRMANIPLLIESVRTGEDALIYLKKLPPYENKPRPEMVLMDLNLPGKKGTDILDEIKSDPLLEDIPVTLMSGSEVEVAHLQKNEPRVSSVIYKSVELDDWIEKLNTFV